MNLMNKTFMGHLWSYNQLGTTNTTDATNKVFQEAYNIYI